MSDLVWILLAWATLPILFMVVVAFIADHRERRRRRAADRRWSDYESRAK